MKTAMGAVGAALAASVCCIGPVVFSLFGFGALAASTVKLQVYRPWFLALTVLLLGVAFYGAYRPATDDNCGPLDACVPRSRRVAKTIVWMVAVIAVLLVAFPYYIGYLM